MAEDVGQDPARLAGASVALSLTVEGTPLSDAGSGGMATQEPLTDWRLVLGPALLVENLLPVRGTFLVWEQPQVGGLRSAAAPRAAVSDGWTRSKGNGRACSTEQACLVVQIAALHAGLSLSLWVACTFRSNWCSTSIKA